MTFLGNLPNNVEYIYFKVEKSRIKYEKLMNYFINPTDYFPFTISALKTEAKIHICRHRIITKDFFDARELLLRKIAEDEARKRYLSDICSIPCHFLSRR